MVSDTAGFGDAVQVTLIKAPALNAVDFLIIGAGIVIFSLILVKIWKRKTKTNMTITSLPPPQ